MANFSFYVIAGFMAGALGAGMGVSMNLHKEIKIPEASFKIYFVLLGLAISVLNLIMRASGHNDYRTVVVDVEKWRTDLGV